MTEPDWLSTDSPSRMFRHVRTRLSARKLQLLACGCCRLFEAMFTDDQRRALEVVERHADGLADRDEYQAAVGVFGRDCVQSVLAAPPDAIPHHAGVTPAAAVSYALMGAISTPADDGLDRTLSWLATAAARQAGPGLRRAEAQAANRRLCGVFREVVGNPFTRPPVLPPGWVAAGMIRVSETARGIALGVQAEQAFDRLPILADALEDDGCSDPELLHHLRHHTHHLRGCWAVDLVLGKS